MLADSDYRDVPYNPLLDQGYKSVGDVHSTAPPDPNMVESDAAERSGRWAGKNKTECGLHSNFFDMKARFDGTAAAAPNGEAAAPPVQSVPLVNGQA